MFAEHLRRVSLWVGLTAAGMTPFVPWVDRYLHPPHPIQVEPSVKGLAWLAMTTLDAVGDGIRVMVWTCGLAATAVLASLTAFAAAWVSHSPRRVKLICLLPALLAVVSLGVLIAIGA